MSVGPWQIILIVAIILIFFGPKRIPGLMASLGEGIKGFKKAISDEEIDVTETSKKAQINKGEEDNLTKSKATDKEKESQS